MVISRHFSQPWPSRSADINQFAHLLIVSPEDVCFAAVANVGCRVSLKSLVVRVVVTVVLLAFDSDPHVFGVIGGC